MKPHTDGFSREVVLRGGIVLLLFMGFDFAVGAIWGRQAFGAVCPITTVLMVLVLNRWNKVSPPKRDIRADDGGEPIDTMDRHQR